MVSTQATFSTYDSISDAVIGGPGLVAVGLYDDGSAPGRAVIWVSRDGIRWERVALPDAAETAVESVAVGPAGLVAVGSSAEEGRLLPAVWTSADGLRWQRVSDDDLDRGQMSAVAAHLVGYVAVGFEPDTGVGLSWTSVDGRDWEPAEQVPSFGEQPSVNDMIAPWEGFAAFGSGPPGERAQMWTSIDGRDWQRTDPFPSRPRTAVNALAFSPTRQIAVGARYGGQRAGGVVWTSQDGVTWELVPEQADLLDSEMIGLVAVGSRFVAVGDLDRGAGHGGFHAAVWSSTDGTSWRREPDDESFALARMAHVVHIGQRLVVLGEVAADPNGEEVRPAVWIGVPR
ncbi:MAG: hypothetical protein M3253_07240 [Chloroflexota bacterium]|nr:hypothetical protein [Chloroflexota bacterium]